MRWKDIITEKANPEPTKFWMVFNLVRHDQSEDAAEQLAKQTLTGVRGISASREIVSSMFSTTGNTALMMDADQVMRSNHLEMVDYNDPDYLCRGDMDALYRLLNKDREPRGRYGLMQNLLMRVYQFLKKELDAKVYYIEYYGMESRVASIYKDDGVTLNTPDELCRYVYETTMKVAAEPKVGVADLIEMTQQDVTQAVYSALQYLGATYEDESEWMVRGDSLTIPSGSTLLILTDKAIQAKFAEWKAGTYNVAAWEEWRFQRLDHAYDLIQKYRLDSVYQIRFIDEMHFSKINSAARERRFARRRAK